MVTPTAAGRAEQLVTMHTLPYEPAWKARVPVTSMRVTFWLGRLVLSPTAKRIDMLVASNKPHVMPTCGLDFISAASDWLI